MSASRVDRAIALLQAGDTAGGLRILKRHLARNPGDLRARLVQAMALDTADPPRAARAWATLTRRAPGLKEGWLMRGNHLDRHGDHAEAERCWRRAVAVAPGWYPPAHNLGELLIRQRRYTEARPIWRAALSAQPGGLAAPRGRARSRVYGHAPDQAIALVTAWRRSRPGSVEAAWLDARLLPVVHRSAETARAAAERYISRLAPLRPLIAQNPTAAATAAWDAFHLHYIDADHRAAQALLGEHLVACARALPPPTPHAGDRLRVGFASSLLTGHTVSALFGGWIAGLDRSRFDVFVYQLFSPADDNTRVLGARATLRTLTGDPADVATAIHADGLHALIFPELGMDRRLLRVAAHRLAPLQCVSWGHPITTGLSTIDVFLSSAAMEPDGGDAHYTEALARLPGVGICTWPPKVAPSGKTRGDFGLPAEDVVLLVPQSLYKLLPEYDNLYARIAARLPSARIVFLASEKANASDGVRRTFTDRLAAAFAAEGLDWTRHVTLVPHQSPGDFLALNRCADLFLDAPGWSGGRTTLEAIHVGLLPVTRAGRFMRQRHTAGILWELELDELVTGNVDALVDLAVSLGADPTRRSDLRAQLVERRDRLFADTRSVRALESLITRGGPLPPPPQTPRSAPPERT